MAITTEQLIAQAKEAADLVNVDDYVTDPQWIAWLNNGVFELHRLVTNKFKATYYRTLDFTLADDESLYTLPTNFWRLKGLDIDAGTVRRREVRPFNWAERNKHQRNGFRSLEAYCTDRFYNLVGSKLLQIQAEEQAAGNYRLYYVPTPKVLAAAVAIPMDFGDDSSDGAGHLHFDDSDAAFTVADIGSTLALANTVDPIDAIDYTITAVSSVNDITVTPAPPASLFGASTTATLQTTLDDELEPFSEYAWLTAGIKSLIKEESFAQANMLKDQRNLIRDDLVEALETDQGGPSTVIDTDDDEGYR